MNNKGIEKLVGEWVDNMNECNNEEEQMVYISDSMNLASNSLGIFMAQRIIECGCNNCRKGANKFMIRVLNRLEQAVIDTVNGNLKANRKEPLFAIEGSIADSDVNKRTYDEIIKELDNDK